VETNCRRGRTYAGTVTSKWLLTGDVIATQFPLLSGGISFSRCGCLGHTTMRGAQITRMNCYGRWWRLTAVAQLYPAVAEETWKAVVVGKNITPRAIRGGDIFYSNIFAYRLILCIKSS